MLVALVLAALVPSPAHASWTLSAVGARSSVTAGGTPAVFSFTPGTSMPGVAAELELQTGQNLELGMGLDYVTRTFSDGNAGTWSSTVVETSLALRWWLGSHVAVGGGGYFASSIGSLQSPDGAQSIAYIDYGLKAWDYGPFGTVAFAIPVSKFHIVGEGRVTWSAANQARGTNVSFRFMDELVLLGVRFGMGSMARSGP